MRRMAPSRCEFAPARRVSDWRVVIEERSQRDHLQRHSSGGACEFADAGLNAGTERSSRAKVKQKRQAALRNGTEKNSFFAIPGKRLVWQFKK